MNASAKPEELLPDTAGELLESGEDATAFTLRRTGLRPVRFVGSQLIEARSNGHANQVWHDLNIYRTNRGRYVVELIARRIGNDQQDIFRVRSFDSLDAVASWLQAFPAGDDAKIPEGLATDETALPRAVLKAVQLRQQMERIDGEYRSLLSEVFMALELSEPGDDEPALTAAAP
jgi:hypothetical protein